MNDAENNNDESSDSDIFIVKQIKSINNLSVQQTLQIKQSVLNDFKSRETKKRTKEDKISKKVALSEAVKRKKSRGNTDVSRKVSKRKLSKFPALKSSGTLSSSLNEPFSQVIDISDDSRESIIDCFKKVEKTEISPGCSSNKNNSEKNERPESTSPKKYIQKSLIKMFEEQKKSTDSVVKNRSKIPSGTPDDCLFKGEIILDDLDYKSRESVEIDEFQDYSQMANSPGGINDKIFMHNSEVLSSLLKQIIKNEMDKQIELQEKSSRNQKSTESLLLESECEILEKFFKLSESACQIFVRMLSRKKGWHRVSAISYKEISGNLEIEFEQLHRENYVDTNIEDESLELQLNLLGKPEILELSKEFKSFVKSDTSNKKENLINGLIRNIGTQKSVCEMFKKQKNTFSRVDLLKSKVKNCLGMCVRLNAETFQTFYKILLLSSFAHYYGDEEKRISNELLLHFQISKKRMKFPEYKVCPTVIFETCNDFEEYKNAIQCQECCEVAMREKNFEDFVTVCMKVKDKFKKLLNDNKYLERMSNLKSFLRKFSAGVVYARILTNYCTTFQKRIIKEEVINTVELLLSQDFFLQRKRGQWYEILSKCLENQKQSNAAADVILTGLKDPYVNDVQKLTLQLRGQLILKKKNYGVKDKELRSMLENTCMLSVQEPAFVEIKGKALEGNQAGHKIVYVQECEGGMLYAPVEKWAILYYNSMGFPKGFHKEGSIVQSIYFLLFYDIIYGLSPEGVFQSPYQEAPLDFNSPSFYSSRKEKIDLLLSHMIDWSDEEVERKIRYAYSKNYDTNCIINWREILTPELLCEVIRCITMPILVLIFQRLVKNFREVRAGFPDLTLWNPETNKCKFVEVKSPLDKLSPAQRLWLDYLRSIGLNCEVCNVKNS